jgi:DNA-binding beta-propeller fold protein YncE
VQVGLIEPADRIATTEPTDRTARRRRPGRTLTAAAVSLAVVAALAGCSDTAAPQPPPPTTDAAREDASTTSTSTTESVPGALADQTPPSSTLGIDFRGNQLWIVDFYKNEILVVDPDSGTIINRVKSEQNVSDEVDNISVDKEGVLYWVGFNDGAVGEVILGNNLGRVFSKVPLGLGGIAVTPDGKTLYVGGSMTTPEPFYALDTEVQSPEPKPLIPQLDIRAFGLAPNGKLYGPRWGSLAPGAAPGALLEIDPATASYSEVVSGLDGPIAAKVSPDGTHVYVLSQPTGAPPALQSVDLATHAVTTLGKPATPLVANLAVAPDGRIFVTSYNTSAISIIDRDGSGRTLAIGQ